jgi:RNA polymerase-binding transcription factor DksA
MTIDTKRFKEILIKEQNILEGELKTMGRKNPENPSDWIATTPENGADEADDAEVADKIEQFENNSAEVEQLEKQLKDVKMALEKMENGNYGICEIGGEEIEEDRLKANPSARTCKTHMNS